MSALIVFFSWPELSLLPSELLSPPKQSDAQSSLPRLIHFSLESVVRLRVGTDSRSKIYNVSVLPWFLTTRNRYNELVFGSPACTSFPMLHLISSFPFLISSFSFLISHFLVPTFSSTPRTRPAFSARAGPLSNRVGRLTAQAALLTRCLTLRARNWF